MFTTDKVEATTRSCGACTCADIGINTCTNINTCSNAYVGTCTKQASTDSDASNC
jgi:hypothetical protein